MKSSDRAIVMGIAVLALVGAFWFLVLSPKREEATKLGDEVTQLRTEVEAQQQAAAAGEVARRDYDRNYHRLVVLGKAVPEDGDTASLLVQLQRLGVQSKTEFRGIELTGDGEPIDTAQTTPPPALEAPGEAAPAEGETPPAEGEAPDTATPAATTTPAPATETVAATLPIGSTVGPAGLPVMPYTLTFTGGFFGIADFVAGLDRMVEVKPTRVGVRGRLLTVDGFVLKPTDDPGYPVLDAEFAVTTYLTPASQGALGGATPTGPAETVPAATTTTASDPTSVPTATATTP